MCSKSTMFMDAPNLAHRLRLIRSSTQRVDEPIKTIIIIIGESKNRSKEAERRKNCKGSSDLGLRAISFFFYVCALKKEKFGVLQTEVLISFQKYCKLNIKVGSNCRCSRLFPLPEPKIQQTKMLVTCQRFGNWFLFGLVWPYSSNQKNIMKVGSKSLLLTCSSNKL